MLHSFSRDFVRLSAQEVRPASAPTQQRNRVYPSIHLMNKVFDIQRGAVQLASSRPPPPPPPPQDLRASLGPLQGFAEIYRAGCQRDVDNFVAYLGPARCPAPLALPAAERGAQPDQAPTAQAFASALAGVSMVQPSSSKAQPLLHGQDAAAQAFADALAGVPVQPQASHGRAVPALPDQAQQGAWRQGPSNGVAAPWPQQTRGSRWGRSAQPDPAREGTWRRPPTDAPAVASPQPGLGTSGLNALNQALAAPRQNEPPMQRGAAPTANGSGLHACAQAEAGGAAAAAATPPASGCAPSSMEHAACGWQHEAGVYAAAGTAGPGIGGADRVCARSQGGRRSPPRSPTQNPGWGGRRFLDAGDPPDAPPLLLFDLNGTLTSHTAARRSAGANRMRPGTHHLRRLQARFTQGVHQVESRLAGVMHDFGHAMVGK